MTTPNLPPLPDTFSDPRPHYWAYTAEQLRQVRLAAYQSGFNAALDQVKSLIEAMGQNKEVE